MRRILIFAGTTEGRQLAERLVNAQIPVTVSAATEYGARLLPQESELTEVLCGRLSEEEMREVIRQRDLLCVVDATHPFAVEATRTIRSACLAEGKRYLRLARKTACTAEETALAGTEAKHDRSDAAPEEGEVPDAAVCPEKEGVVLRTDGFRIYEAESTASAAALLRGTDGVIFLMTGSKELAALSAGIGRPERLYARVLPTSKSLELCEEAGILPSHIIAMQGPFSEDLNIAMLKAAGAVCLLTKETGRAGGLDEKLLAARACGIPAVLIRNPERRTGTDEKRYTEEEVVKILLDLEGITAGESAAMPQKNSAGDGTLGADTAGAILRSPDSLRRLTLVGAGPGDGGMLTGAAREALAEGEVLFGAASVLARLGRVKELRLPSEREPLYRPEEVLGWLRVHPEVRRAVAVFSGDTSFYSGASSMRRRFEKEEDWEVEVLPGISSLQYFAARIGADLSMTKILSAHGRALNLIGHLRREERCMILMQGRSGVHEAGALLGEAQERGLIGRNIKLVLGYELSMPEERILVCTPEELLLEEAEGLYILYAEQPSVSPAAVVPSLRDSGFVRHLGEGRPVPMTKEEVRILSLCLLGLTEKAVFYDIGAGTGSVSVQAAELLPDAQVWAVEMRKEALELLRENRSRRMLANLELVEARAPEGLTQLPPPTHAFIGGSGGELEGILSCLLQKNPSVKIVINSVTLETLAEVQRLSASLPVTEPVIREISSARAERLGSYHLMRANNPVFIIELQGLGEGGASI